jgi:hypothetical protein
MWFAKKKSKKADEIISRVLILLDLGDFFDQHG